MSEYWIFYTGSNGLKCAFRKTGSADEVAADFEKQHPDVDVLDIKVFTK